MNDQSSSLKWSFFITSHNFSLIVYWYCLEKIDFGHAWDLKGLCQEIQPN